MVVVSAAGGKGSPTSADWVTGEVLTLAGGGVFATRDPMTGGVE